jgi:hypothetical protein
MRAGVLAQHGGPPGWLEESDSAGCDFIPDGRSMSPALTNHTTGLGLIYTKCTQNTVMSYVWQGMHGLVLYIRPMPSLWAY